MKNWWTRPCGGREVFLLSIPLIISTSSWTVMNFIDRMFLLGYSTDSVAAVMPAGIVHFALICFPLGIASYVTTFVSQYHGANHPTRIGPVVWQGARLGLLCVPLFLALIPLSPLMFRTAGHEPVLASLETLYFQTATFGAGAEIIAASFAAFFTGLGRNRVVMVVDTLAALVNVVLDYGWIFGHFGLPERGIEGAAWATVVSLWLRVFAYGGWMMLPRYRVPYHLWSGRRLNLSLFRRLLRFGAPSGLQMVVEVAGFTLFILLVGNLGSQAMAATSLAFNVNMLAFVPMLGLSIALSTIVGKELGRNKPDLAARATWTAFWMAELYMSLMAAAYFFLPDVILAGHTAISSREQFEPLRNTTVILLRFVALYCLFDAMNVIFVGTLKGAGDTRFILFNSLVVTPIPLITVWIGIHYYDAGLLGCWSVVTAWIVALGVINCARFLQGRWRHMRVIEPELLR